MKTLDELRDAVYYEYDTLKSVLCQVDTDAVADRIQADIDRYYLPRPLFEDGEPVQFGDEVMLHAEVPPLRVWCIAHTEDYMYLTDKGLKTRSVKNGERFEHPLEPDTQDRLMLDVKAFADTCADMTSADALETITNLLERQRRIDGMEQ